MAMSKTAFSTLCLLSCVVGDLFDGLSGLGYGLFVGLSFALVGLVLSKLRQSFGDSESKKLPYQLPTFAPQIGSQVTLLGQSEKKGIVVGMDRKRGQCTVKWLPNPKGLTEEPEAVTQMEDSRNLRVFF